MTESVRCKASEGRVLRSKNIKFSTTFLFQTNFQNHKRRQKYHSRLEQWLIPFKSAFGPFSFLTFFLSAFLFYKRRNPPAKPHLALVYLAPPSGFPRSFPGCVGGGPA